MRDNERTSALRTFTIAFLVVYAPIETWYSWPELWDPYYVVDFVGIVLLAWGAMSHRGNAGFRNLAVLAAGFGWTAANFWRALFDRVFEVAEGTALDYGWMELCFSGCIMLGAIIGMGWTVVVATRSSIAGT
ncbi:MAG: hypothetical protein WD690_03210 [Vicinamibacterales bacterium]